jgi:GNAT superfamily N-acetyltransferase
MDKVTVTKVNAESVREVVSLFDAYRQFYSQQGDFEGARKFLAERLTRNESVILLASVNGRAVGFAQLYPSFSSLSMKRVWILNDLFVTLSARGQGVGTALLEECKRLAIETDAKELTLETMKTNFTAQHLYESLGWKRDEIFHRYTLSV